MDEEIRKIREEWRVENGMKNGVRRERRWVVWALGLAGLALAGVVVLVVIH